MEKELQILYRMWMSFGFILISSFCGQNIATKPRVGHSVWRKSPDPQQWVGSSTRRWILLPVFMAWIVLPRRHVLWYCGPSIESWSFKTLFPTCWNKSYRTTTSFDIICLENQEEDSTPRCTCKKGGLVGESTIATRMISVRSANTSLPVPFQFHKLHGFYLVDGMLNLLPGFLVDCFNDKLLTKMSSDPSHSSFLDLKWTTRCLYFLTYLGMINGEVTQKNMQNMTLGSFSAVCKWLVNQVFV